jgi:hypothetical protein
MEPNTLKTIHVGMLDQRCFVNQSLFLVLLKTKVPNGTGLSPRLSKNLSQALRTDRLWPLLRPSNFSTSRLAGVSWGPTGPSSPNMTSEAYLLFIVYPLSYFLPGSLIIDPIQKFNEPLTVDPKEVFLILWIVFRKFLITASENGPDVYPNLTVD